MEVATQSTQGMVVLHDFKDRLVTCQETIIYSICMMLRVRTCYVWGAWDATVAIVLTSCPDVSVLTEHGVERAT